MTKVSGKLMLSDTQKLNIQRASIQKKISAMRNDLRAAPVRAAIDPHGQLLKKLNQINSQLPQMTLLSELRDTGKLLKDFQKPIDKFLGKKSPFEKMPLNGV